MEALMNIFPSQPFNIKYLMGVTKTRVNGTSRYKCYVLWYENEIL